MWIRRWIKDENAWQTVIKDKIDINKILDFGANYAKSVTKLINNQFWIDVLNSYSDILNSYQQNSTEFTMSSPVFHNNKIKVGGIPIYIKSWYGRGITFVNEFVDESGNFYSQTEFEKKIWGKIKLYSVSWHKTSNQGLFQKVLCWKYGQKVTISSFTSDCNSIPLLQ